MIRMAMGWMLVLGILGTSIGCGDDSNSGSSAGGSANLSDPKSAAKTFVEALTRGDVQTAKAAAIVDAKTEPLLEGMASMMKGMADFRSAAVEKFGEDAVKHIELPSAQDITGDINSAEVKIDGDTAVLTTPGDPEPLTLRKIDGKWKVDLQSMPDGDLPEQTQLQSMGRAASEVAAEIRQGKHATMAAAEEAMNMRMMQALMQGAMPQNGMPEMPKGMPQGMPQVPR